MINYIFTLLNTFYKFSIQLSKHIFYYLSIIIFLLKYDKNTNFKKLKSKYF